MAKRDYYKVLDVARDASEADIKKAYRRLAMKLHPDRNAGGSETEDQFKEAKQASEVLSDPAKRATYDQHGHEGLEAQRGGAGFHGGEGFGDIFGDVFGDIFGGRRGGGRSQVFRGADLRFATLVGANLRAAHLEGAMLSDALVKGADCKEVVGLSVQQLEILRRGGALVD